MAAASSHEMIAAAGGYPTVVAGGVSGETRAAAGHQSGETTTAAAGDIDGETAAAAETIADLTRPGALSKSLANVLQILWKRQQVVQEQMGEYQTCRSSDCGQMKWLQRQLDQKHLQMAKQELQHHEEVQELREHGKQQQTELLDAQRQLRMQQDVLLQQKKDLEYQDDQLIQLWQNHWEKSEELEQVREEQRAMAETMEKVLEQRCRCFAQQQTERQQEFPGRNL